MNDEAIKAMAIKAGCWAIPFAEHGTSAAHNDSLVRFAKAIAEDEREQCAKVCEEWISANGDYFAEKIRERSNVKLRG